MEPQPIRTRLGAPLFVERSNALPLSHVSLTLRTGSALDPQGQEGLPRLTSRLLRMGTGRLGMEEVDDRIDAMGAQLAIGVSASYVHLAGTVVSHNLEPFVELLGRLCCEPAQRKKDLAQLKRQAKAQLTALCDDDRALCGRHYRAWAFADHPYARSSLGSRKSLSRIRHADVVAQHRELFVARNAIFGGAGDLEPESFTELIERAFAGLGRGPAPRDAVAAPKLPKGRRLLIVDKPARTQTQVLIGTLGTRAQDADHTALLVANTAFGGLFTSRLTHEVRSQRGWSYGASSSLGHDRQRELFTMWTHPAANQARDCIALQLDMLDQLVDQGLKAAELRTARDYLRKGHAFDVDTAAKRLDQRVDRVLFRMPQDYYTGYLKRVAAVSRRTANAALRKRLSRRDQVITVVGTASELEPQLRDLPRLSDVQVVPFDRL